MRKSMEALKKSAASSSASSAAAKSQKKGGGAGESEQHDDDDDDDDDDLKVLDGYDKSKIVEVREMEGDLVMDKIENIAVDIAKQVLDG